MGFSPRELARRLLGRLAPRLRREPPQTTPEAHTDLDDRAATAIRAHEKLQASLFDRAARLTEKARRLERAGTPSESAGNRAARARKEVAEELAALRAAFVADTGKRGLKALDRQLRNRYPFLELPGTGH